MLPILQYYVPIFTIPSSPSASRNITLERTHIHIQLRLSGVWTPLLGLDGGLFIVRHVSSRPVG